MFYIVVCLFFSLGLFCTEEVEAGTFDNAYTFYAKYENEMVFRRGSNNQGDIYYAIIGKESNASIKYKTIGWKVTVKDNKGKVIDTIYYDLEGDSMELVNEKSVKGYNYQLYKVTLKNLKSRMSSTAKTKLTEADCSIIFDSCTTTIINGVIQGGVTDDGIDWGKVYTTYNSLIKAQDWSAASKEVLKSFYGKEVQGLFYTVTLKKGTGIETVTGGGRYCFGTKIKITATPKKGYSFKEWKKNGKTASEKKTYSFTLYDSDVVYTAYATVGTLKIKYHTGFESGKTPTETKIYTLGVANQTLSDFDWTLEGYHQIGWSTQKGDTIAQYKITEAISDDYIKKHIPELDLYAVWEPNVYHIVYDACGGIGEIASETLLYTDVITLPSEGFTKNNAAFQGWSDTKYSSRIDYDKGERVAVAAIVKTRSLQNYNNKKITIYAVWDKGPNIYGDCIYVSLEDAQKGDVTPQLFSHFVYAEDAEDGRIDYGIHRNNYLVLLNYQASDYTRMRKSGYVTELFQAMDSSGNIRTKMITVYVVQSLIYDSKLFYGDVRFISDKYYKKENGTYVDEADGGLSNLSVWRYEKSYRELLDDLFLEK